MSSVIASFGIMLCLGGVYAWSIFVPELKQEFRFSAAQTQLIFGTLIAVFPITMILSGKLEKRLGARRSAMISAIFFAAGYLTTGLSGGNFFVILFGVGLLTGIGTGFGYLISLTTPVKFFPQKKGFITGIAAAGFGLAAVILTGIAEILLRSGHHVLDVFIYIGLIYGAVIFMLSFLMPTSAETEAGQNVDILQLIRNAHFTKLITGIFFGTFAGLMVIGNLKPLGAIYEINDSILALGISLFAIANFAGRLTWGFISDYLGARWTIFIALTFQAISIFLLGYLDITSGFYLILSSAVGFGFGSNFVLFAKETAHEYGVSNLGLVYPYVFLGYAIAGIFGPMTGGLILDF